MSTMIESCPSPPQSHSSQPPFKNPHGASMNNVIRLMLKKGVITDLARVSYSLDLSSPHMATTVNATLKPLETLSRIVNQPQVRAWGLVGNLICILLSYVSAQFS